MKLGKKNKQVSYKNILMLTGITMVLSGCLLSDNWPQITPTEINYQERHDNTLERRNG